MTRVGIHQLHYLPWLRYFEKIDRGDVFIVLDDIQYNKNGWQNRNRIKAGDVSLLLTVPVFERMAQNLDEVRVDNGTRWRKKHWRSIEQAYSKAPYFYEHAPFLEATYARDWEKLNDLNRFMLEYFIEKLGIASRVAYSSELDVPGVATERLLNLIRAVGGDCYYSGAHALEAYLDSGVLERAGVGLELQQWEAPEYPQLGRGFIPDLSILDILMNCGPGSLRIIKNANSDSAQ
jgi:hypothetical protein